MSDVSAISSASDIQMDYMKLLIAQLQNQNPLEPLDNNEMASQLAQFSELEQLESMNATFAKVLTSVEQAYATSLLDKEVTYAVVTETGEPQMRSGVVQEVHTELDGQIILTVGVDTIGLDEVLSLGS